MPVALPRVSGEATNVPVEPANTANEDAHRPPLRPVRPKASRRPVPDVTNSADNRHGCCVGSPIDMHEQARIRIGGKGNAGEHAYRFRGGMRPAERALATSRGGRSSARDRSGPRVFVDDASAWCPADHLARGRLEHAVARATLEAWRARIGNKVVGRRVRIQARGRSRGEEVQGVDSTPPSERSARASRPLDAERLDERSVSAGHRGAAADLASPAGAGAARRRDARGRHEPSGTGSQSPQRHRHGRAPAQIPNCNPHAKRFVKTVRTDCPDHFVIFGERHLRHLLKDFVGHHQGLGSQVIRPSVPQATTTRPNRTSLLPRRPTQLLLPDCRLTSGGEVPDITGSYSDRSPIAIEACAGLRGASSASMERGPLIGPPHAL